MAVKINKKIKGYSVVKPEEKVAEAAAAALKVEAPQHADTLEIPRAELALFDQVFGAEPRTVSDRTGTGTGAVADFDIGDLTLRLHAIPDALVDGHGMLQSVTLAVDLAAAPAGLDAAGIGVAHVDPDSLRLDPAETFGLELELVDAASTAPRYMSRGG